MRRFFFLFFISFLVCNNVFAQQKHSVSFGGGFIINNHLETIFIDAMNRPVPFEEVSSQFTYGLNLNYTNRINKFLSLRTGVHFYNSEFDSSLAEIGHTFSVPLNIGAHWKSLSLFSGLEYEYTFFTFLQRDFFMQEINKETCSCEISIHNFNIPASMEIDLSKHLLLGIKYQFLYRRKVENIGKRDELRNVYLYTNIKF